MFDVAATDDPGTTLGQLIVNSQGRVFGYVSVDGQPVPLSGKFSPTKPSINLKGKASAGEFVTIKLVKQ